MYLVADKPTDIVQAMMDGKSLSPEPTRLYARVLRETIADLAREHGIVTEPEPATLCRFSVADPRLSYSN
jgi:hypothetical protein